MSENTLVKYNFSQIWNFFKDGDKITVDCIEFCGIYYLVNGVMIPESEYLKSEDERKAWERLNELYE